VTAEPSKLSACAAVPLAVKVAASPSASVSATEPPACRVSDPKPVTFASCAALSDALASVTSSASLPCPPAITSWASICVLTTNTSSSPAPPV
jgi:hypothetical protein